MQIHNLTKTLYVIRLLVLIVATAITVAACQTPVHQPSDNTVFDISSDPTDCRIVAHKLGETEICGQPQSIAVFGSPHLESLLALEVQPIGYAADVEFFLGDYSNPAQQIPYVGNLITQPIANVGSAGQPSIEGMLKAKPDLIIGTNNNDGIYDLLSGIAPTLLLNVSEPFEPDKNLRTIAQAVNRTEKAEELIAQTQQQIAAAQDTFAPFVATHPEISVVIVPGRNIVIGRSGGGLCSSLIQELGFQIVVPSGLPGDDSTADIVPISLELLPELNDADVILVYGYNFENPRELDGMDNFEDYQLSNIKQNWAENPLAQSLNASKNEQVYFIQGYLCSSLAGPIGTELYLKELQEKLLSSDQATQGSQ